jgi:antitoxin MazE
MMQVQKWGNSLGVRIPKALAMKVGLDEGSEVDIDVEKGHIIIKPKSKTLDELLSNVTTKNLHSEIETGKPQGREIW